MYIQLSHTEDGNNLAQPYGFTESLYGYCVHPGAEGPSACHSSCLGYLRQKLTSDNTLPLTSIMVWPVFIALSCKCLLIKARNWSLTIISIVKQVVTLHTGEFYSKGSILKFSFLYNYSVDYFGCHGKETQTWKILSPWAQHCVYLKQLWITEIQFPIHQVPISVELTEAVSNKKFAYHFYS